MRIDISDNRPVTSIQQEFSTVFPYLKLEFFSGTYGKGAGSPKKDLLQPGRSVGECRTVHNRGSMMITPNMSVADLEQSFRELYGLSVQVFRKSGKVWLETTVTDSWTLEEQNRQGKDLSER